VTKQTMQVDYSGHALNGRSPRNLVALAPDRSLTCWSQGTAFPTSFFVVVYQLV